MQFSFFLMSPFWYMNTGMIKNLNFVEEVLAIFGKDDEIIVVSFENASL